MTDYMGERCPHCGVEYCACWMCLPGSQYHHHIPRLVPRRAPRLDPRTIARLDSTAPRGEYRARQVSERPTMTPDVDVEADE